MEQDEKLNRKVETLRGIYGSKGIDLNEDEVKALAHHWEAIRFVLPFCAA